jgi:hypothetical protein
MSDPIRAIQVGLGPIGAEIVRALRFRPQVQLVGAVDVDPAKLGRDAGELAGVGPLGIAVNNRLDVGVVRAAGAAVALHSTGSYLAQTLEQIEQLVRAGLNVVSTCEELAYAQALHPDDARRLDTLAREHGVTVLGTGVNPGYVFDTLVLTATAACQRVDHVRARRVLDAGQRRIPLQQKVGAGLTVAEFAKRVDTGLVRHVGLAESMRMVADAIGWPVERLEESTGAIIAESEQRTPYLTVAAGAVAGVHQTGRAFAGGREVLSLDLQMYVGAPHAFDEIEISGEPGIKLRIEGGTPGDPSTAAIVVNAIPAVIAAPPGLTSMKDLPLVHCWGG